MTEPWQPISDEELERQRVSLQAMADSGYAAPGGGIAGVLSMIARIDLERNRADEAVRGINVALTELNAVNAKLHAAEAEVARLRRLLNRTRDEMERVNVEELGRTNMTWTWIDKLLNTLDAALGPKPKEPSE